MKNDIIFGIFLLVVCQGSEINEKHLSPWGISFGNIDFRFLAECSEHHFGVHATVGVVNRCQNLCYFENKIAISNEAKFLKHFPRKVWFGNAPNHTKFEFIEETTWVFTVEHFVHNFEHVSLLSTFIQDNIEILGPIQIKIIALPSMTNLEFNKHLACIAFGGCDKIQFLEPNLFSNEKVVCFKDILIGTRMTGFFRKKEFASQFYLQFRNYIKMEPVPLTERKIVYISRTKGVASHGRFVLNEDEVMEAIRRETKLPSIKIEAMGSRNFFEQIKLMQETCILIGMHGADLLNSFFLPPNSVLLELSPLFKKYPYFENIARLRDLRYINWMNTHFENTIWDGHSTEEVKDFYFSNGHRISWDPRRFNTIVHIGEFREKLKEALAFIESNGF